MKHSIRIVQHNTSVSIEPEFWQELQRIAAHDKLALSELIAQVDAQRHGNLSSALRLYVLKRLKEG